VWIFATVDRSSAAILHGVTVAGTAPMPWTAHPITTLIARYVVCKKSPEDYVSIMEVEVQRIVTPYNGCTVRRPRRVWSI
jgi:hypothetical protein